MFYVCFVAEYIFYNYYLAIKDTFLLVVESHFLGSLWKTRKKKYIK